MRSFAGGFYLARTRDSYVMSILKLLRILPTRKAKLGVAVFRDSTTAGGVVNQHQHPYQS